MNSITRIKARAILYQTKILKLWVDTNFSRNLIANQPETAAAIVPTITTTKCPSKLDRGKSPTLKAAAPIIAGVESKKENRVAAWGFKPLNNPAEIVTPLRLTPGIKENPCTA